MAFTGSQLRTYRQQAGITQAQLAEAIQVTRNSIAKMEAYNRAIKDIEVLKALQHVLAIPYEIIGFIPIEDMIITGSSARIISQRSFCS